MTNPIQAKLNFLKVDDLYNLKIAKFVFNWNRNKTPSPFFDYFIKSNQVTIRATRQSSNLNIFPDIGQQTTKVY